jgi:hypothetical protein
MLMVECVRLAKQWFPRSYFPPEAKPRWIALLILFSFPAQIELCLMNSRRHRCSDPEKERNPLVVKIGKGSFDTARARHSTFAESILVWRYGGGRSCLR